MKALLFSVFTCLVTMIAFAETDLSTFKWKNRVLVLLAPSDHDPRLGEQQATATAGAAGFSERDLIVVTEIGTEVPFIACSPPGSVIFRSCWSAKMGIPPCNGPNRSVQKFSFQSSTKCPCGAMKCANSEKVTPRFDL